MNVQTSAEAVPTVVNGINTDDLFALIERVKTDPRKGKTHWRVSTTWQGQTRSRAQVEGFGMGDQHVSRQFAIDVDEPYELGGSNRFANPQEYLIAALNACMTVGYVAQSAVRGITLRSLVIETEGEIDLRGFPESIRPCRQATTTYGTRYALRATEPGNSLRRFTRP